MALLNPNSKDWARVVTKLLVLELSYEILVSIHLMSIVEIITTGLIVSSHTGNKNNIKKNDDDDVIQRVCRLIIFCGQVMNVCMM